MDVSRCPRCKRRLVPVANSESSRTRLACLFCDEVDPLQTDAIKWANSGLAKRGRGLDPLFETPKET
jgi:hypothetical protein